MSGQVKLPQLYALQLERIIARGLAASEILGLLRTGSEAALAERIDPEVKWERLLTYARDNGEAMESAVLEGYRFPFITIGGIKSLLAIKFRKQEEDDYRFAGDRIEGLRLTVSEHELLRSMVPSYWKFTRTDSALPHPDNQAEMVEITIAL